jgi:hypothetical protein
MSNILSFKFIMKKLKSEFEAVLLWLVKLANKLEHIEEFLCQL